MTGIGDPGDEDVVRMVDEVIARQRIDELAVAAPVRGGDGHELTVAGCRRDAVRPGQESVSVGCDQCRRDEAEHLLMVGGRHGATIQSRPDAALTPR